MPAEVSFRWVIDPTVLGTAIQAWSVKVWAGVVAIANMIAARIEAMAKQIAPWNDISGAARQGLRAFVESATNTLTIYCVTSVFYGIFLEMGTRFMGPRPSIMPAMESQYGPLMAAIRALVG